MKHGDFTLSEVEKLYEIAEAKMPTGFTEFIMYIPLERKMGYVNHSKVGTYFEAEDAGDSHILGKMFRDMLSTIHKDYDEPLIISEYDGEGINFCFVAMP